METQVPSLDLDVFSLESSRLYILYLSVCLWLCIFFKTEPNLVFPLCVGSEGGGRGDTAVC